MLLVPMIVHTHPSNGGEQGYSSFSWAAPAWQPAARPPTLRRSDIVSTWHHCSQLLVRRVCHLRMSVVKAETTAISGFRIVEMAVIEGRTPVSVATIAASCQSKVSENFARPSLFLRLEGGLGDA